MTTKLPPRALSRPGSLPIYALVGADNVVRGIQTFENPDHYPGDGQQADGSRYLPVFGDEPPADLDRQYYDDEFEIEGDRVVRTRTVHERSV
jgi:hypothetical protein